MTTCQICGREIKTVRGRIARHKYKRPEYAWKSSDCEGAGYPPYEESKDRLVDYIAICTRENDDKLKLDAYFRSNPPPTLVREGSWTLYAPEILKRPKNFNPATEEMFGRLPYSRLFFRYVRISYIRAKSDAALIDRLQQHLKAWKAP